MVANQEIIILFLSYLTYIHVHVFLSKLPNYFLCVIHDLHNDETVGFFLHFVCFAVDYVEELRE